VFLAGHSVAMVTYCVTKMIPTCSPVIVQFLILWLQHQVITSGNNDTSKSTSWKILETVLSHLKTHGNACYAGYDQVYSSSSLVPSVDCSSLPTGPWNEGKLTLGPVYRKSRTVFAPGSCSKISNFVITELFYFHILSQYRVSLFIQEVSDVYTSLFLDTDELKVALLAGKVPWPFRPL